MKLVYLEKVPSTHIYLKEYLKIFVNKNNICFYTFNQTDGLGSQHNKWQGEDGDLFFSFKIDLDDLPNDLPLQSASLYFSYILCEILQIKFSNVYLKWPNDFYINDNKIGGTITNKTNNSLLCGIGLNIINNNKLYGILDIDINKQDLLKKYFNKLEEYPSWKQIFSKYKLEFHRSKNYYVNINISKISLKEAKLNDDGSLNINNKKVYSLR
jgi:BirA family biotin operon repressor/biotin-[acetyl-CoA-carboxylase] ligase